MESSGLFFQKIRFLFWLIPLPFGVDLSISTCCRAQSLPGFTLNGEYWTYAVAGQPTISGILVTPVGSGPFPAVVIGHGKGGTVTGFSLPKAREMVTWGLVCIAPRYTHAADDPDFGDSAQEGARPENIRRARACLDILSSLSYVDPGRIGAYGNSMGAFVTIALCAEQPTRIKTAAMTAGGVVQTGDWPAPDVTEAQPVRAPFLILHGDADTTVLPSASALFKTVLDQNSVPNQRITYPGVGHELHQVLSSEVYTQIRNWFTEWSMFDASPPPAPPIYRPDRPRGIFVLDSQAGTPHGSGTFRDANIRNLPFVSGYTLRMNWDFVETAQGQYDFAIIDNIFAKLPAGQQLSLIITPFEPAYIASTPGVTTWQDVDRNGNPLTRAVPWDAFLRQRRQLFLQALASHPVAGVPLREDASFLAIDPYLPGGFTGIRDPVSHRLKDLPGYSRANLLAAVQDELRTLTTEFPNQFVQIGFWKFLDSQPSPEAWEDVRQSLLAEFNGTTRPRVGFFMENLAASRPGPGQDPVTGFPVTDFGAPLFLSRQQTWTAFQALTSWKAPFTGPDKVANASPADGMQYAFDTYGAQYFELYVSDIDNAAWQADFQRWHTILTIRSDLDRDGDVDSDDFNLFVTCAAGAATPYRTGCQLPLDFNGRVSADGDGEGDVDASDFGLFQRCFGGANTLPDVRCED